MVIVVKADHTHCFIIGPRGDDVPQGIPCTAVDGTLVLLHPLVYNIGGYCLVVFSENTSKFYDNHENIVLKIASF